MSGFASTLEAFFTERLLNQRQASPHTVAAYRDTFRLLLRFVQQRSGKSPARLEFTDLDAATIAAFLQYLEDERGCTARTRNARLTGIRSLFYFAALRHPEHAGLIQRVLAIPTKRHDRAVLSRPARSRPARGRIADRAARVRTRRAAVSGRRARPWHTPTLPRQGPQGAMHPPHQEHRGDAACLAKGAQRWSRRPAVPRTTRRRAQPRRRAPPRHPPRAGGRGNLPFAGRQTSFSTRAPAQLRHAAAPCRRGHIGDRALARARAPPNNTHLPTCRPRHEGTRPGPHRPAEHAPRPIPTRRPAPRVPRHPVTMWTGPPVATDATRHGDARRAPAPHSRPRRIVAAVRLR